MREKRDATKENARVEISCFLLCCCEAFKRPSVDRKEIKSENVGGVEDFEGREEDNREISKKP